MLSNSLRKYLSQRAKIVGAIKSADSIYQEIDHLHKEALTFSTHYFNKENKEVMYVIHDIIEFIPDSEVYLREREWGKKAFDALSNWQNL